MPIDKTTAPSSRHDESTYGRARRDKQEAAADRRRKAFREVMEHFGLSPAEISRATDVTPSSLFNFLSGRTNSLNIATIEPLAELFGVPISRLVGLPLFPTRGIVATGEWRRNDTAPSEMREQGILPDYGDSYYMTLMSTEMNQVFPPGTILEVVNFNSFRGELQIGHRVVVRRWKERFFEDSCREIEQVFNPPPTASNPRYYLTTRSNDPRFANLKSPIPWPIRDLLIETGEGEDIETAIWAVVVRSVRDEIGFTR